MADMEVEEAVGILRDAGYKDLGCLGRAIYVVLTELEKLKLAPITPSSTVERQIELAGLIFVQMVANGKMIDEDSFDFTIYGERAISECLAIAELFCDVVQDRYNLHHL